MPMPKNWTAADIPDLSRKFAIVTGTGGLGYETALELTRHGASVVLAGRNPDKGVESLNKIRKLAPGGDIRFALLDLASLVSVAAFGNAMNEAGTPIDILVNNAGVMSFPDRRLTKDGFEAQFGTNHLGHFALTARLLPLLRAAKAPRVTTVSSFLHRIGKLDFDDLQAARHYSPRGAYGQSKLANLLFMLELQRRSDARGWNIMSNAAHPGGAATDLIPNGPGAGGALQRMFTGFLLQSAADGAWPQLFGATAPDAKGATYYGPSRFLSLKGPPKVTAMSARARNARDAKRLWEVSEKLTGVTFA